MKFPHILRFFHRQQEENIVAAKLGIIIICRHCHEKIHGEDYKLHEAEYGFLTDEDGTDIWVHDKSRKSNCRGKHKRLHFAEPMRVDV
jgi:hypothetical protein